MPASCIVASSSHNDSWVLVAHAAATALLVHVWHHAHNLQKPWPLGSGCVICLVEAFCLFTCTARLREVLLQLHRQLRLSLPARTTQIGHSMSILV